LLKARIRIRPQTSGSGSESDQKNFGFYRIRVRNTAVLNVARHVGTVISSGPPYFIATVFKSYPFVFQGASGATSISTRRRESSRRSRPTGQPSAASWSLSWSRSTRSSPMWWEMWTPAYPAFARLVGIKKKPGTGTFSRYFWRSPR
jgi:hypothetical protein